MPRSISGTQKMQGRKTKTTITQQNAWTEQKKIREI